MNRRMVVEMPFKAIIIFLCFVLQLSNGDSLCPVQIASICECRSPPLLIRCAHKNLKEFPDFSSVQVGIPKHLALKKNAAFKSTKNQKFITCLKRIHSNTFNPPNI